MLGGMGDRQSNRPEANSAACNHGGKSKVVKRIKNGRSTISSYLIDRTVNLLMTPKTIYSCLRVLATGVPDLVVNRLTLSIGRN